MTENKKITRRRKTLSGVCFLRKNIACCTINFVPLFACKGYFTRLYAIGKTDKICCARNRLHFCGMAKYPGKSTSLVDALASIGVDSSFSNRKKIAKANSITNYSGTAPQNTKLLDLLKSGKLIKG